MVAVIAFPSEPICQTSPACTDWSPPTRRRPRWASPATLPSRMISIPMAGTWESFMASARTAFRSCALAGKAMATATTAARAVKRRFSMGSPRFAAIERFRAGQRK